jgi:hypothetical protein
MSPELFLFAIAFLVAFPVVYGYLRSKRDPEWEERWKQLPQLQRERISTAVRNGEPLEDPEEAELGAGFARQQRASVAFFTQSRVVHLILASVLLLAILTEGSPLIFFLTLLLLTFLIWLAYRERVTKRNLARAERAASRN